MFRYGLVLGAVVAACGTTDDRPQNLTYITEAILAPTCGAAECHSQYRQWVGDEYDTVDAARATMWNNAQISFDPTTGTAANTYLIVTITKGSLSLVDPSVGLVRMPYDAPMPNEDVALIEQWIQNGAAGAQCLPGIDVCGPDGNVHVCTSDGNIGVSKSFCVSPQTCKFGTPGSNMPGVCQ